MFQWTGGYGCFKGRDGIQHIKYTVNYQWVTKALAVAP